MEDEVIALVPWIDFMNHDPDSKAYVAATRDGNGPAVLLKTDRPYQGDEQIFDSYGRRSNDEIVAALWLLFDSERDSVAKK